MTLDLKDVVVNTGLIACGITIFMLGFGAGEHRERMQPKPQFVKGVDCPMPGALEVLVLMVARDGRNNVAHSCSIVMRRRIDPS